MSASSAWAGPQADPGINKIYITNVRDVSFVVSWKTDISSDGKVTWGATIPPSNTTTDSVVDTTTHYVTVSGLNQNTIYYFQVTSDEATDDDGGAYYQVTTGPTLGLPIPGKTVRGYMYGSDETTTVPTTYPYDVNITLSQAPTAVSLSTFTAHPQSSVVYLPVLALVWVVLTTGAWRMRRGKRR